jgi:hypothetical protein
MDICLVLILQIYVQLFIKTYQTLVTLKVFTTCFDRIVHHQVLKFVAEKIAVFLR